MTIAKTIDESTIMMFSRLSIFGAAVESSAPSQLIDNITAEIAAARATMAPAILAIGRRFVNTARHSIDGRRRDAFPPK